MPKLEAKTDWLRADSTGRPVGVDRKNNVIHGYVMAQEGPFKTQGRGQFNLLGLQQIVEKGNAIPAGLKSRFTHPTLSADGLGKYLGRAKNLRLDTVTKQGKDGLTLAVPAVRGDLHLDRTAFESPSGNLGKYVMDLAESDPDALSSSLVLKSKKEFLRGPDGKPMVDDQGEELPPLWFPESLHASDIVDTGEAVDGLLSVDSLPDALVRQAADLLDCSFPGASREVIEERLMSWLGRYLDHRFGEKSYGDPELLLKKLKLKLLCE